MKPNHVNVTHRDLISHFIMSLVCTIPMRDPRYEAFVEAKGELEVKLSIGGVDIDNPVAHLEAFLKRIEEQSEAQAGEIALKMVGDAGLDKLREAMEEANNLMRDKLRAVGATFEDDDNS